VTSLRRPVVVAACLLLLAGCTDKPPAPDPSGTPDTGNGLDVEPGLSEPVADPLYPDYGNPSLDVLAYDLALSWSPAAEELSAIATITVRAVVPVNEVTLDFSREYTVDSSSVDGESVRASWDGDDLSVPRRLSADERTVIEVRYHGTPGTVPMPSTRGDFAEGLGLRVTRDGELWTMQEPYGASTWYPVNDIPSDEAVYDIRVTVPYGWAGVASGMLMDVDTALLSGTSTYHWRSTDPVASYLTTLAIGEYTLIEDETEDGRPLTYWLRTGRDEDFEPIVKRSPELIAWLEERFGPYPFPSGGVVFVDSESAMETQQMVTFGAGRGTGVIDADSIAETLLHEYAHQWFGNAVTPTDWTGLWLNEGWAMYCEMLWIVDEGIAPLDAVIDWAHSIDEDSRPFAGPPGQANAENFAEANVYFGPALMLYEIHRAIGDEAFFAMGRAWVQERLDTSVDREEFAAFVNDHTGQDFTELINLWLDSETTPELRAG
jgi:aminopeptidase N